MLTAQLCVPERKPALAPHRAGILFQVLLAWPYPEERLGRHALTPWYANFGMLSQLCREQFLTPGENRGRAHWRAQPITTRTSCVRPSSRRSRTPPATSLPSHVTF